MWGKKKRKEKRQSREICATVAQRYIPARTTTICCVIYLFISLVIYSFIIFFHFFPSERRRGRGCHSCPITLARGHMSFVVDNKTPSRHRRLRLLVFFKNSAVSPHLYLYIHTYTPFIFVFFSNHTKYLYTSSSLGNHFVTKQDLNNDLHLLLNSPFFCLFVCLKVSVLETTDRRAS